MAKRTEFEPGFVQRVAAGFRYALSGRAPGEWFGPADPIAPAVDGAEAERAGVAGRQFDYRVGFNVDLRPRSGEPISFGQMRALADNCDLLRLVIETRKDQICCLPWAIQPREEGKQPDARCEQMTDLLRQPDREHEWETWLRMLLEDLFVIDAPTLYVRKTVGGEMFGFEPIDGSTIKRVIDATGRTPADGTAYQQILKGMPATDYTRDELIYRPRNQRTHKAYGYSPVEQIINTVNIALRRQLFTTDYFTAGTVPDAIAGAPEDWSVDQIREFQTYWDLLLMDDQASLRRVRFMPAEIAKTFKETKAPPLKDQFDEWLARIICYCFSIDVTPFVAQVNRAVADTNREQSLSEGLAPVQRWVKGTVDDILRRCGAPDLELMWQEGTIVDPVKRSQVHKTYVDAKILHPDEVRAELGKDPLTPEQKEDLFPAPPPQLGGPVGDDGAAPLEPGEKKPPKLAGGDDETGKYLRLGKKKVL